jgi:hypothetical protein
MYKCLFLEDFGDNSADGSRANIPEDKKDKCVLEKKKKLKKEHEGEQRSADVGPFAYDLIANKGKRKVKFKSSKLKITTRAGFRANRPTPIGPYQHGIEPKY